MQVNYRGTNIKGSPTLLTSVANAEIITEGTVLNFSFMNTDDCVVIVNSGGNIFLRAEQGLFIDVVNSFKVVTAGVAFNWVATLA